jgi:hypothetical protein
MPFAISGRHRNTITKVVQFLVPLDYRRRERPASKKVRLQMRGSTHLAMSIRRLAEPRESNRARVVRNGPVHRWNDCDAGDCPRSGQCALRSADYAIGGGKVDT